MSRRFKLTTTLSDADSGEVLEKCEVIMDEEFLNNTYTSPEYSVADVHKNLANGELQVVGYENYFGLKNTENPFKTHIEHLEEYCSPKLNTEPAEADIIKEEFK